MQYDLFTPSAPQSGLPPPRMRYRKAHARPLYVMLKPGNALARQIWALPQTDHRRPAALLHMTILPVADKTAMSDADMLACRAALSTIRQPGFSMAFDRIMGGSAFVLKGDMPAAISALHHGIAAALSAVRALPRYHFRPHLTLDYREGGAGCMLPEPICWPVDRFLLIESVHGKARHIEHGCWPLH